MQDAFVARTDQANVRNLAQAKFVHNAALLVRANGCVTKTLTGAQLPGRPPDGPLSHRFWAMGGEVRAMDFASWSPRCRTRTAPALHRCGPVATWHATIDPRHLTIRSFRPANDATAELYGWAVASDDTYTYLYGYCYRQFISS
jgi:hypothetical protein